MSSCSTGNVTFAVVFPPEAVVVEPLEMITSTGGRRQMSVFLVAWVLLLQCGRVHPLMISAAVYSSMHVLRKSCFTLAGTGTDRCDNGSNFADWLPQSEH